MKKAVFILLIIVACCACTSEPPMEENIYTPIPYQLDIPTLFKDKLLAPLIPADNPLTEEGVALGKKLFFDKQLSANSTQSCASCHQPKASFVDENQQFSVGVDGLLGFRNAMPLFNLAWNFSERFNWDGSGLSLERQAFEPVTNPIELHANWQEIANILNSDTSYPALFKKAFGTSNIDSVLVVKAIAQFERTLISANSKFDQFLLGNATLTPEEQNGFKVFMDEAKGDCFHCHGSNNNPLWTDNQFHNNGLDAIYIDLGLGAVTGDPKDNGKFKSPSIRNLSFTAPYMHDGRFATLDEVIDFYSEGLQWSPNIDPLMKNVDQGGVQLSEKEKADLKAFLLSLNDYDFITNTTFPN